MNNHTSRTMRSALRLAATALLAGCAFFSLPLATLHAAPAAPTYSIVARFPVKVEGVPYYDYLRADADARRLYITLGKTVAVFDLDSGKQVGEITGLNRAHGVAISPDTGHGFATSGQDNKVLMFDTKTLATLKVIDSTGSNPDGIEYDPGTKRIYVANHGSGQVTVIDPADGAVVGTVAFEKGDTLEGLAFDGRGHGFVNAEKQNSVLVFDLATLKPLARWSAAPNEGGTGLACDPATHRLFMATNGNNTMTVLDSDTGKVITSLATAEDADALAFNPDLKRIYVPGGKNGQLTIIQQTSADAYTVLQNLDTKLGCRAVTLDNKTGNALTAAPDYGPAPAPVKGSPRPPRPAPKPGTFEVIVIGTK